MAAADHTERGFQARWHRKFWAKRQRPHAFDQQAVEAAATISACIAAWRVDRHAEWQQARCEHSNGFSVSNDLGVTADRSRKLAVAATGCILTVPTRTGVRNLCCRYLLGLVEIRQFERIGAWRLHTPSLCRSCAASLKSQSCRAVPQETPYLIHILEPADAASASGSGTRGRRPFKPATEPRDLNPTDKTRANHIVEQGASGWSLSAAEQQLTEVLENFEGRHRNLLEIFEARAAEMEEALEPHAVLTKTQRRLVGAYFLHEYSFEASALFNPSIVRASRPVRRTGRGLPIYPEPSRGRRRAHIILDFPVRARSRPTAVLPSIRRRAWRRSRRSQVARRDLTATMSRSFSATKRLERTGHLSSHRRTIQRHRGCQVRGISEQRSKDLLRDLHCL